MAARQAATQYEPEIEEEGTGVPARQQLTRDSLGAQHRAKAALKLGQGQTPEVVEGKARAGLFILEGMPRQFSSVTLLTGFPEWEEGDNGSVYTYTGFVGRATDETGKEQTLNKVVLLRLRGASGVKAAQVINNMLFEAPEEQGQVAVTLRPNMIKGQKGSYYAIQVSEAEISPELVEAAGKAGL